jgi:shikimate dehydrogenase
MTTFPEPIALMGMVGDPVAENPIDQMFNYIFAKYDVPLYFIKIHVTKPETLRDVIAGAQAMGFQGLGVTVPYKEKVMPLLDEVDDNAQSIGASNYITFEDGRTVGHQNDGTAIVNAIERIDPLAGKRVLLLGAGGAARGVGVGLVDAGVSSIVVAARRQEPGEAVATALASRGRTTTSYLAWGNQLVAPADVDIILNATSAGAAPGLVELKIDWSSVPTSAIAVDVVTGPRNTPFILTAHEQGMRTVDGVDMLAEIGTILCRQLKLPSTHEDTVRITESVAGKPIRALG